MHVAIEVVALADLPDETCAECSRVPVLAGSMVWGGNGGSGGGGGGFLRGGGVGGVSCRSIPSCTLVRAAATWSTRIGRTARHGQHQRTGKNHSLS